MVPLVDRALQIVGGWGGLESPVCGGFLYIGIAAINI